MRMTSRLRAVGRMSNHPKVLPALALMPAQFAGRRRERTSSERLIDCRLWFRVRELTRSASLWTCYL